MCTAKQYMKKNVHGGSYVLEFSIFKGTFCYTMKSDLILFNTLYIRLFFSQYTSRKDIHQFC